MTDYFLWCGRGSWEIGIPYISTAFPISITLFFPDLEVFAAIIDLFAVGIVHYQVVRPAHPGHVTGVSEFYFSWLPKNEPRARE